MAVWNLVIACLITELTRWTQWNIRITTLAAFVTYLFFCAVYLLLPGCVSFSLVIFRTISFVAICCALKYSDDTRMPAVSYALTALAEFGMIFVPGLLVGVRLSGHLVVCAAAVYGVERCVRAPHRMSYYAMFATAALMVVEQILAVWSLFHG